MVVFILFAEWRKGVSFVLRGGHEVNANSQPTYKRSLLFW